MKDNGSFDSEFDNAERIGYLIASYIKGTLKPLERKELDEWILESEKNELLFDQLTSQENIQKTMEWYSGLNEDKAREKLTAKISFTTGRRKKIAPFSLIGVAATVLIIAGIAAFFVFNNKKTFSRGGDTRTTASFDPLPGSNKAILTIAGGKQVHLDSASQQVIEEGHIKAVGGTVFYSDNPSGAATENLLTVPRGGQYKVVLSDGTEVWLNAESTLSYPVVFTGLERRVTLTGEGYFKVTKNKEKPFIVESAAGTVKVLGTEFDINSYGDENVFTTTLLEGSVQLNRGAILKTLRPGQQARVEGESVDIREVNTEETVAWKRGEFVFNNTTVASVVTQLARWYDLSVEFRNPVSKHINASISREVPLSRVLHYLEQTGEVHFKIEGKKLVVSQ